MTELAPVLVFASASDCIRLFAAPCGGYAAIVVIDGNQQVFSGHSVGNTNRRREVLKALIAGLEACPPDRPIAACADENVLKPMRLGWAEGWRKRNWTKSNGEPVEAGDLWGRLLDLSREREITWDKTQAHVEVPLEKTPFLIASEEERKAHRKDQEAHWPGAGIAATPSKPEPGLARPTLEESGPVVAPGSVREGFAARQKTMQRGDHAVASGGAVGGER